MGRFIDTDLFQLSLGGFSYVYLAKSLDENDGNLDDLENVSFLQHKKSGSTLLALKKVRVELPEQAQAFDRELGYHKQMRDYDNVLKLFDGGIIGGFGYFLFPFYKNGSLQDLLFQKQVSKTNLDFDFIITISRGIVRGLDSFHSQNPPLAFRDLKVNLI